MSSASWWAKRWETLMQEWGISVAEARNNRAYRVKSLEVIAGGIDASIHDRDAGACKVQVRVPTLSDAQWEQIGEALASQPLVASQLISGAMAPEIEQLFGEVGAHLLPTSPKEIVTHCTLCPANKCRHLPLVFSLFAEMLGNDPGLLFTLRGRDMQQLMREVRDARAVGPMQATANQQNGGQGTNGHAAPYDGAGHAGAGHAGAGHAGAGPAGTGRGDGAGRGNGAGRNGGNGGATSGRTGEIPSDPHQTHDAPLVASGSEDVPATDAAPIAPPLAPLSAEIDTYWGNRALMRQFHHHIAPPAVELSLLRRLGPISASDDAMVVYEQLVALYRRITEEALALAYASDDETATGR